MTALYTANSNALHIQHSLQSRDLLLICQLSNAENAIEQAQSFTFEQFFGFACHLFVTTDSSNVRRQLAGLFPKFGPIAIFSLVKIAYHFDSPSSNQSYSKAYSKLCFKTEVQQLALQALESMPAHVLAIGLAQIIEEDLDNTLKPTVVSLLARTFYTNEEDILSLLSRHLSKDSWNAIEANLIQELSSPQTPRVIPSKFNNVHALSAHPQATEPQLTEVA